MVFDNISKPYRAFGAISLTLFTALPVVAIALPFENGIGEIPTLNQGLTQPLDISDDGRVVVGEGYGYRSSGESFVGSQAFRWTLGGDVSPLGVLGDGQFSAATGVNWDGSVVVGYSGSVLGPTRAFIWTESSGMVSLLELADGRYSVAEDVSADGKVVVGAITDFDVPAGQASQAYRWTVAHGIQTLGSLNGGSNSGASAVSADGTVVVGSAVDGKWSGDQLNSSRAYRWTENEGMVALTLPDGTYSSRASGVSANGSVVVGSINFARVVTIGGEGLNRAFRWTEGDGIVNLGILPGDSISWANAVSGDGKVVVGESASTESNIGGGAVYTAFHTFRWTDSTGMQSVEDWLRSAGVVLDADVTSSATSTNYDGSVVVGTLKVSPAVNRSFGYVARVSTLGSGLVTLADLQNSLQASAIASQTSLSSVNVLLNGVHSRPLDRRVDIGQKAFWISGDWGHDDHADRSGSIGMAEVGLGYRFNALQLNLALGEAWGGQDMDLHGRTETEGAYLFIEGLVPVVKNIWATFGGYVHEGDNDLVRAYTNGTATDFSRAKPASNTWAVRARLDWENAATIAGSAYSPYADLSYGETSMDAYTETSGGFPARFDDRKDTATELRLGVNGRHPLNSKLQLIGALEATHRFEKEGENTTGSVIGLFDFDIAGISSSQDWLLASIGLESAVAGGIGSFSLNGATQGGLPSAWISANWQKVF